MEHNDPGRRPYNGYANQAPQQPGQFPQPPGSADRYRQQQQQAFMQQQSPTPTPAVARPGGESSSMYAFPQGSQYPPAAHTLPSNAIQYDPAVAQNEQMQRHSQPQQPPLQSYPQYGGAFYGAMQPGQAQAQAQAPPIPAEYEQMSQYPNPRPRTSGASETVPSQFGAVPQTPQYNNFLPSQPGPSNTTQSEIPTPMSGQYQPVVYGQHPPSTSQNYGNSSMMDTSSSGGPYTQFTPHSAYGANHPSNLPANPPGAQMTANGGIDEAFEEYQQRISGIFTLVNQGALAESHMALIEVSRYLLGNIEPLGLHRDLEEKELREERVRMWDEFNNAWFATLQRQYDMTEQAMQGQSLRDRQSIMSIQALEALGKELVRLCDTVERHGLVDYQMGVSEESIMDLLLKCLSLLESSESDEPPSDRPESSATAASRQKRQ